jgi:hypothetical protein
MPESHKAERRRVQKNNVLNGIGDETGRIPVRSKAPPPMGKCSICQFELKITKTNTELTAHALGKHAKTMEECFPGAKDIAADLLNASNALKASKGSIQGQPKADKKKQSLAGIDDLLNAGLTSSKKGSK